MNGAERRKGILEIIKYQDTPVSGSVLAKKLNVSRQVIVQDIALLRAENHNIVSTTKGYMSIGVSKRYYRVYTVDHCDNEIQDELNLIVDQGGKVWNVIVDHPIYGEIKADLVITSRQDVKEFTSKVKKGKIAPLNRLTNGIHKHEVEAESEQILDKIEEQLRKKNYLIEV